MTEGMSCVIQPPVGTMVVPLEVELSYPALDLVGICRFSFLGAGDWKDYNSRRGNRTYDEVTRDRREMLFDENRLNGRFRTLENITLPSLAAQSDPDFTFIILTSEELPDFAMKRLKNLADQHAFLRIDARSPKDTNEAILDSFENLGYALDKIAQFRLDDDDAVGKNYIRRVRKILPTMQAANWGGAFSVTFPNVLIVHNFSGEIGFNHRHFPHNAAGQVIHHPRRAVYNWAHQRVGRDLPTFSDPSIWVLQSYLVGVTIPDRLRRSVCAAKAT